MRRKEKSKKKFVLFCLLYTIIIVFAGSLGFLCYLSFDLNKDMVERKKNIESEISKMEIQIEELRVQSNELDDEIDKKRAEAEQAMNKSNLSDSMLQPPSSDDSIFSGNNDLDNLQVGQIIDEFEVIGSEDLYFKAYEIEEGDSVYNRINGRSYYANDNIALSDLRYLKLVHYNFEHNVQVGELIINAAISDDVINIFKDLFYEEYEIESMRLIDDYWTGDGESSDSNSIEHNNTSAFCYREITGGGRLSNHAFGRAIDINPQQNPYVWYSGGQPQWSHENASAYIDRTCGNPHVIVENDTCYNIFRKYGFSWGGLWSGTVDYQHFEKE